MNLAEGRHRHLTAAAQKSGVELCMQGEAMEDV
jgi:hypothetical protein